MANLRRGSDTRNPLRLAWRLSSAIRGAGVRILSTIAELEGLGGACFASIGWLAERCGVHPNTVRYWLRRATRLGYLVVVPQWRPNGARRSSLLVLTAPLAPIGAAVDRAASALERADARFRSQFLALPQGRAAGSTSREAAATSPKGRDAQTPQDREVVLPLQSLATTLPSRVRRSGAGRSGVPSGPPRPPVELAPVPRGWLEACARGAAWLLGGDT